MAYNIENKKQIGASNLWDAEAEALIALLAKKISDRTSKAASSIVRDLNFEYLRKKDTTNKQNYGATAMQRQIINAKGC